jgi:hypothetical protein
VTLSVVIRRLNQLRHVEGAIRAAHARGHKVVLECWPSGLSGGPKDAEQPSLSRVPRRFDRWAQVQYGDASNVYLADAILVPSALGLDIRRQTGTVLAALQTTWSDLIRLDTDLWDVVYSWSKNWARWWADAHQGWYPGNIVPVGLPIAEHLYWQDPRLTDISQRTVLYFPFPFDTHDMSAMLRWGYRYLPWGDRAVVRAARKCADRLGWPLVIKSRPKTTLPAYSRERADVIVEGDQPGEPTAFHMMTQAGLFIHHNSAGVVEAGALGRPAINVSPWGWSAYEGRGSDFEPMGPFSFYSWIGISESYRPGFGMVFNPFEVDQAERERYCGRFIGGTHFNVGDRILNDLEERVARRKS